MAGVVRSQNVNECGSNTIQQQQGRERRSVVPLPGHQNNGGGSPNVAQYEIGANNARVNDRRPIKQ